VIPPFSSKVGKTLMDDPKYVSISVLRDGGNYLVKYSNVPHYLQVFGGHTYSFSVGGEDRYVSKAISALDSRRAFNTLWRVKDLVPREVHVDKVQSFELDLKTPALLVSPYVKSKRKVFTNAPSVVFFNNVIDVTGMRRDDVELRKVLSMLDEVLWEEPSTMSYAKVIYGGKEIVGLTGKLRYSVTREQGLLCRVLEAAMARGIGSSRRNGFGTVELRMR